jgi:hypothetical protein
MKLLKSKSILLLFAALILLIFIAFYIFSDLAGSNLNNKQIIVDKNEVQVDNSLEQFRAKEIIADLLSSEETKNLPEISIIKATESHIKANVFYNPGGGYVLAAKINGEWKKVLEGNGIPKCSEISQYGFPSDIVPGCINESNGNLIKNEWPLIKEAIANCEVKEVMQAHSLYVGTNLKNGNRLEGFEPKIDDIIRLATEAQGECGKILMATE